MVKTLSYQNIKGKSGTHTLKPLVAIIGENASGKSAIIDAFDIATVGFPPRMRSRDSKGVPLAEMWKLSSGPFMAAEAVTATGRNRRQVDKRGDKLSKTETVEVEFSPMLRDHTLYTSLSAPARVALVASLVKLADTSGFSVPELLGGVKNIRLEENSKSSEQAIMDCYSKLDALNRALAPLDWLSAAIDSVKEDHKLSVAARKTMTGVTQGISILQQQDEQQVAVAVAAESKLKTARIELGELQSAFGAATGAVAAAQKAAARKAQLEAVVKPDVNEEVLLVKSVILERNAANAKTVVETRAAQTPECYGTVQRLLAERKAAVEQADGLVRVAAGLSKVVAPAVDENALRAKQGALIGAITKLQAIVARREKPIDKVAIEIRDWLSGRQSCATTFRSCREQIAAIEADIKKFMACEQCPTCLATGGEWQARWKAEQDAKISTLQKELDIATVNGTNFKKLVEAGEEQLVKMRAQDVELTEFINDVGLIERTLLENKNALEQFQNAQKQIADAKEEERKLRELGNSLNQQITVAQEFYEIAAKQDSALALLEHEHKVAVAALHAAKESLKAWQAAQTELQATEWPDVAAFIAAEQVARDNIALKQAAIKQLEEQCKGVALARADLKRQMEAATAAVAAQASVDVLKAAKELLEKKQAELVAVAFESLLSVANKFTSCLIPSPIEYREGEVGYLCKKTNVFVTADTFNTAWQDVLYVGLCVSLAAGAKNKIVVLDNFTNFIGESKRKVLERLLALVHEGVIQQAIVADGPAQCYTEMQADTPEFGLILAV